MNIDWIEDATHYGIGDDCHVFFRDMIKGESYEFKNVYSSGIMSNWLKCTGYTDIPKDLIERPKKQDVWGGVGLPPIGMASCKYLGAHKYDEWTVVNIFAHYGHTVFVDFGDGWRAEKDSSRFRPIKTAEQLEEEEKKKAIDDMQRIYEESMLDYSSRLGHASRPAIKALYEAGYRKQ